MDKRIMHCIHNRPANRLNDWVSVKEFLGEAKNSFDQRWRDTATEVGSLAVSRGSSSKITLTDFELIKSIGHGRYGRVYMAAYKSRPNGLKSGQDDDEQSYVAIKVMSKVAVCKDKAAAHIIQERKILQSINFKFLIAYKNHFKDLANLYLVMEYVAGGDVYTRLKQVHQLDEPLVNFYVSQIVLSFEYLHCIGIVFRDLKPENTVIDLQGYLKLIDFGLAKNIRHSQTRSLCGTPEYIAPEVIRHEAYSYSVDWWAMGIYSYELLHGKTPFHSSTILNTLRNIIKNEINFFRNLERQDATVDFIKQLLKDDVAQRLTDIASVKNHPYFQNVDWLALYNKLVSPPYKPQVNHPTFTRHFRTEHEHEQISIEEFEVNLCEDEFREFEINKY